VVKLALAMQACASPGFDSRPMQHNSSVHSLLSFAIVGQDHHARDHLLSVSLGIDL